jgi:hypothetical protein
MQVLAFPYNMAKKMNAKKGEAAIATPLDFL